MLKFTGKTFPGDVLTGAGSCPGDSGGPLLVENLETLRKQSRTGIKFVQIGVVHGGISTCDNKNFSTIFARIEDPEIFYFVTKIGMYSRYV